ncbi:MAG: acetoacetate decarboxylase family protein [Bacillota bacterium]
MLKGYTLPRTPLGKSGLLPAPPWHFVGDALVVEYEADERKAAAFLPEGLELQSGRCAVYFMDWQYASDQGEEYLDPVCSQYRETIFLLSARYEGMPVAYCPFIWVSQDKSMMRGLIQGWPKQFGETWITRDFKIPSKAGPAAGQAGKYGASLSLLGRRLVEATVAVQEETAQMPSPTFAGAALVRYFPELEKAKQSSPAVHELVRLKSRDVSVSPVWKGDASFTIFDHPYTELPDLKPVSVADGYRFSIACTIDDLEPLKRYN